MGIDKIVLLRVSLLNLLISPNLHHFRFLIRHFWVKKKLGLHMFSTSMQPFDYLRVWTQCTNTGEKRLPVATVCVSSYKNLLNERIFVQQSFSFVFS